MRSYELWMGSRYRKATSKGRESLQHGKENRPFQQRADARRTATGRATVSRKAVLESPMPPMPSVYEAAVALCAAGSVPVEG